MPRVFGEYLYRREVRVQIELNHAHEDIVAHFTFFIDGARRWSETEVSPELLALRARLDEVLPALLASERDVGDDRPVIEPVYSNGGRAMQLSVVFRDLVQGAAAVTAVCRALNITIWLRVEESPPGRDPLAALRGQRFEPWGSYRVFVWALGEDRARVTKVVRDALQCSLAEATAAIANVPCELLVGVDRATAERAARALVEAGCDADHAAVHQRR
jgi:ribosomal protein L7/L12